MDFLPLSIIFLCGISFQKSQTVAQRDTLSFGQLLRGNETLSSPNGAFVLGFFEPSKSPTIRGNRYLGIWYGNGLPMTVVWVANREKPITDFDTNLSISGNGDFVLANAAGATIWSTQILGQVNHVKGKLLDSGNLVLQQSNGKIIWESFDHPTDTFLPGNNQAAAGGKKLISWKNEDDPSPGDCVFTFSSLQLKILNQSRLIWSSGPMLGNYGARPLINPGSGEATVLYQFTGSGENVTWSFTVGGDSIIARLTVGHSCQINAFMWQKPQNAWVSFYSKPSESCDFHGICGPWGVCENGDCRCMKGFKRREWLNNTFQGCVRNIPLKFSAQDVFFPVENTFLPDGLNMVEKRTEEECRSNCLNNNSCTAYAYSNSSISSDGYYCFVWNGDVTGFQGVNTFSWNMSIRLDASELDIGGKSKKSLLPVIISAVAVFFLIVFLIFVTKIGLLRKILVSIRVVKLMNEGHEEWKTGRGMAVKLEDIDFSTINQLEDGVFDAPLVDFESVRNATSSFSDANKIGRGGFGSVFLGKLKNENVVAVKRLSKGSRQGQREFANEVRLIAKLQHKNLVRLLGWSVHKDERVLIYEYMPNKSLDMHLFGKSVQLSWDRRFSIIEGIAHGLCYLHHHSRMHIVHRDLKTSNILLDTEMTPKISDFGIARIINSNQSQGNTTKVVGTLGYMSPEYALDGIFSDKSDVFSFGVIILEIITGRRNTGYYSSNDTPTLVRYVWLLWNEGRSVELLSPSIEDTIHTEKALKCIQLGLLCLEENAADRPSMNSVISMLTSSSHIMPAPMQPGFSFMERRARGGRSSKSSVNVLTEITMEAR